MARPKKEQTEDSPKSGGLLTRLISASKSDYATILEDDDTFATRDWIDSGNVLFNALLSGKWDGGYPSGKITSLCGISSTGKTQMGLEAVKYAQKMGYTVIIYDSEFSLNDKETLKARGIDTNNLLYIPVDTLESLKTSIMNILEDITENDKVIILIDSMGNLSSNTELTQGIQGVEKGDVGRRSALVKSLMRSVTLKAGIKQVPIIAIQHTYQAIGTYIPQTVIASGSGVTYNSSIIIEFTKAQEKSSDNEVIGAIITAKNFKNRFSIEKAKIKFGISFSKGVGRYSGLAEWCEENGVFEKSGRGYIYKNEKFQKSDLTADFWNKELNDELGEFLNKKFRYQSLSDELTITTELED